MTERHVITSAAVSDDVAPPSEPHARELRILMLLAICAALPRVMFGLMIVATRLMDASATDMSQIFLLLRVIAIGIDIAALVMIGQLHALDAIVPGLAQKRKLVIALSVTELLIGFAPAHLLYNVIGTWAFTITYTIPSFAAQLAFALWLGAMLSAAGKKPMLIMVSVGAFAFSLLAHLAFFEWSALVSVAVGIAIAIEVTRVRRSL